jgi:HAD superfamily hydrolase (TIGR01450 family)
MTRAIMRPVRTLRGSARPLTELYDVALLDLDGVVYVGPDAVPGAPEALASAREHGMRLAFVTNNAARPPHVVADHLTELGIVARADEVITSAQAAARYLADRLPGGARVLVVGTTGLEQALRERGLLPVHDATGQVDAVVQGYSPDLNWQLLAEGAVAINRGVLWVATNLDPTVPSPRGPLPGNGSLVAALRHATGAEPIATGKPDPTMHRESLLRSEARRPLVVGDRLDTDIEGANAVGCDSLLVFSGVTTAADLLAAPAALRPTYLAQDVRGLLVAHPAPRSDDRMATCGRWRAVMTSATTYAVHLELSCVDTGPGEAEAPDDGGKARAGGAGPVDSDDLDALRALCAAAWSAADEPSGATVGRTDQRRSHRPGGAARQVATGSGGRLGDAAAREITVSAVAAGSAESAGEAAVDALAHLGLGG